MSDEPILEEKKTLSLRDGLRSAFKIPYEGSKFRTIYPLPLYIIYILVLLIYPLARAKQLTDVWVLIDRASVFGTLIFGIALLGVEFIYGAAKAGRPSIGPTINVIMFLAALVFLVLFVSASDVRTHLVLLFVFSAFLVCIDVAVICRFIEQNATESQILKRRLLLFGVDLPLATGLLALVIFGVWELTFAYRSDRAVIDAFLTGALALELALTNAAATYLIVFTKIDPWRGSFE